MEGLALEMGVEAVKYVVDSFMQQLNEQKQLIGEAPFKVGEIEKDLLFLKDYLKNPVKSDNLITRDILRELGDSIYRAEDAIDSFITEEAERESRWFPRVVPKSKLVEIAKLIKSVGVKLKEVRVKVENEINRPGLSAENAGIGEYKGPPGKQEYSSIFIEEEKILRKRLTGEAVQPDVIFITGTHGIGKTALAAKMYHDSDIRNQFTNHIWIGLSDDPTPRNVFLALLRHQNKLTDEDKDRNDSDLSDRVTDCLKGEPFLLVLDDVLEIKDKDWKRLKSALLMSDRKSKVLITSNNDETARFIAPNDPPVKLNLLTDDDSWSLLRSQVFPKLECPPELEDYGKLIAANCNGLLGAIEYAGDTLKRKDSKLFEMSHRQNIWRELSLNISFYEHTSLSSYARLPHHLKSCFLYLGVFPKGSKFSVSKLVQMWIAEGFVRPTAADPTFEGTALAYLKSLIDKNLVIAEDYRADGTPKTCTMNALVYNFCKTQAGMEHENFLQEFWKRGTDYFPSVEDVDKNRRICIHAHISPIIEKFISSKNDTLRIHLRSFVSHSEEVFTLQSGHVSSIRAAFKLLRVLDAKPIKVNKIHKDLCKLFHLRYVTLSLNGDVLPQDISKLQNMQTLIVHTTSSTLSIESDILEINKLKHFKTNASAILSKKSKVSANDNIQTLCGISPKSCTQEFFNKTPNLKILGIRGQLALILDARNDLLGNLAKVEKLKLLNDAIYEGKLNSLPQFPPRLKCLTLSATFLDLARISILGSLQKLEELKLNDNAFVGETWEVSDRHFPNLKFLHIKGLDFKEWKFSGAVFPKLTSLMLFECKKLKEIPLQLAEISTFQKLRFCNGKTSAAISANEIFKVKRSKKQTDNSIIFDFPDLTLF